MALIIAAVASLLLLFQVALVVRAALSWTVALAGPPVPGSIRRRISVGVRAVTEPVLAPVRRVVPPLRLGSVALDTSFIVVFVAVVLLRRLV